MEYKVIERNIDGEDILYMDITEEFVSRFGDLFAPIEKVLVPVSMQGSEEHLKEAYNCVCTVPTALKIDKCRALFHHDVEDIEIVFKSGKTLSIDSSMMWRDEEPVKNTYSPELSDREVATILLNMQLDMDYGDVKPYGKETVDMLEEEITVLRCRDSSLYYVLENIARENSNVSILIDGTEED